MGLIKNYSELAINEQRKVVLDLFEEALSSIQPQNVLLKNLNLSGNILTISDKKINLEDFERVFLVGFGKGSGEISKIIEGILEDKLTKGFVIDARKPEFKKIEFTLGTHPLPSLENIEFTQNVVNRLSNLTSRDLVFVVICGGGSVMFDLPFRINLEKLIETNDALLKTGADIFEMNTVRKHLSNTKGGGLAKILFPAKVFSLIFSDVAGNDLSVIASGPTVKDQTSKDDAQKIINKYKLESLNLTADDFTETPKDNSVFENIENILMLSNLTALNAMKKGADEMNIKAEIFSDKFQADADLAGKALIENTPSHTMLLAGGETTVKVRNPKGVGGRNQELILASLFSLDKNTVIASLASDGWDNSPAAGAIGDIETLEKARKLGLNPQEYLNENNSLVFFKNLR
ncbi:MAG: hypothetical protein A2171_02775, partial [Candidatus Levybacteria bacterium RBG_13_35_9]